MGPYQLSVRRSSPPPQCRFRGNALPALDGSRCCNKPSMVKCKRGPPCTYVQVLLTLLLLFDLVLQGGVTLHWYGRVPVTRGNWFTCTSYRPTARVPMQPMTHTSSVNPIWIYFCLLRVLRFFFFWVRPRTVVH
ncbi:hypothetical protein H4582DRAFT_1990396 [Lactarius indigo]|nr:hypothetical protein H4582DRAFT_1990396 [Lactarius indigo]